MYSYAFTHPGAVRRDNQDNVLSNDKHKVYAVADGVGGSASGQLASKLAVEVIEQVVDSTSSDDDVTWPEYHEQVSLAGNRLLLAINRAHTRILDEIRRKPENTGMKTTIAAILIDDGEVHIGHVGDSRVYCMSAGILTQLTKDHSYLNMSRENGTMTEEEINAFPHKHAITHALGMEEGFQIEYRKKKHKKGDLYLLSSDGLTGFCDDTIIEQKLAHSSGKLKETTDELFQCAMANGGKDNISVIIVEPDCK